MKFILLLNVKRPIIIGLLTFISMINTTSERLKANNFITCQYFSFYEQLKLHAQLSWALGPDLGLLCLGLFEGQLVFEILEHLLLSENISE